MVSGFRTLMISIILIGLFFLALVNFGYTFAINNNSNWTIRNEATLNSSFIDIQSNLQDVQENATAQKNNTESETPQVSGGFFLLTSLVGAVKVFTGMTIGMVNAFVALAYQYLGIPPIVLSVLLGILIITMIFYGWRVLKAGE